MHLQDSQNLSSHLGDRQIYEQVLQDSSNRNLYKQTKLFPPDLPNDAFFPMPHTRKMSYGRAATAQKKERSHPPITSFIGKIIASVQKAEAVYSMGNRRRKHGIEEYSNVKQGNNYIKPQEKAWKVNLMEYKKKLRKQRFTYKSISHQFPKQVLP